MNRRAIALVVAVGLTVSLGIAVLGAPWASSSPDGLERVASDKGFESTEQAHATAASPAAGYSTWIWRGAGVVLVFGLAAGLTAASSRRRRSAPAEGVAARPTS